MICKFLAIYRTIINAFSLMRCSSKSALLKSVLSVQIGLLLATIGVARGNPGGSPPPLIKIPPMIKNYDNIA